MSLYRSLKLFVVTALLASGVVQPRRSRRAPRRRGHPVLTPLSTGTTLRSAS